MKTVYAACLSRLGLSQAEAAELHGVRLDTVKHWSAGRSRVPDGAWNDLRACEALIVNNSDKFLETLKKLKCDRIDINDIEADSISLMVAADLILNTDLPVVIGETQATQVGRQMRRPN